MSSLTRRQKDDQAVKLCHPTWFSAILNKWLKRLSPAYIKHPCSSSFIHPDFSCRKPLPSSFPLRSFPILIILSGLYLVWFKRILIGFFNVFLLCNCILINPYPPRLSFHWRVGPKYLIYFFFTHACLLWRAVGRNLQPIHIRKVSA